MRPAWQTLPQAVRTKVLLRVLKHLDTREPGPVHEAKGLGQELTPFMEADLSL